MIRPIFSTSLDAELSAEQTEISELSAYPNPVVDVLTIQVNPIKVENISVYNTQGNMIYSGTETSLDMSAYSSGFYFIRVQTMGSPAQTLKVIKF